MLKLSHNIIRTILRNDLNTVSNTDKSRENQEQVLFFNKSRIKSNSQVIAVEAKVKTI